MTHEPMLEGLLPCPFCGGEPRMMGRDSGFIYCLNDACGAEIRTPRDSENDDALAVRLWNTRTITSTAEGDAVERVAREGAAASWLRYDELKRDGQPIPNHLCDIIAVSLSTARAALNPSPALVRHG